MAWNPKDMQLHAMVCAFPFLYPRIWQIETSLYLADYLALWGKGSFLWKPTVSSQHLGELNSMGSCQQQGDRNQLGHGGKCGDGLVAAEQVSSYAGEPRPPGEFDEFDVVTLARKVLARLTMSVIIISFASVGTWVIYVQPLNNS